MRAARAWSPSAAAQLKRLTEAGMTHFRIAALDDSPVSDAALEALLTDSYVRGGYTDPAVATGLFAAAAVRARGSVLVAHAADGDVLGTATLVSGGTAASRLAAVGDAELQLLCVRPKSRGRGVGAALIDAVVELARLRGAGRVALWTQPTMRAAQRLYEGAGFRRVPALDFSRDSRTFMVYELVLGGEDGIAARRQGPV